MERLTARNEEGEMCKCVGCRFAEKLALYEDLEELERLRAFPLAVGQEVYFIYEDKCSDEPIKCDWCVSHPHKILDVSFRGFWTGESQDFPLNADFNAWNEEYFLSYEEAETALKRMEGE